METNTQNPVPVQPAQPIQLKKIGRVKGGYLIASGSFKILEKNKSIMLFPLLALLIDLMIIGVCVASYFYSAATGAIDPSADQESYNNAYYYVGYFLFYVVTVFIASFFQAGMVAMVNAHLNGHKISFGQGITAASKISGKILCWSVVAATIGVILNMIAERFKLVGRIVAKILGATWDIVTFFIVPVLVLEKETVGSSIKRSAMIFKSKWGETIIATFSVSLFFMLAILGVFCMMLVFFFLTQPSTPVILISAGLFLLFLVAVIIASMAIEGIYRTVLYDYAVNGRIAPAFEPQLITDAVKTKK